MHCTAPSVQCEWRPEVNTQTRCSRQQSLSSHAVEGISRNVSQCRSYNQLLGYQSSRYCPRQANAFNSDTEHGTVIHVNLAEGRFIHFAVDNIDIKEGTLDGQNTLHWQTGQNQLASSRTLRRLRESNPQSLR